VEWTQSSPPLASPHGWRRIVRVGPRAEGSVELQADPGAPRAPIWTQPFPLYDTHLDWLFGAFEHVELFRTRWRERRDLPVGSGGDSFLVIANGRQFQLPSHVADDLVERRRAVKSAVEALVPSAAIDVLEARRQSYLRSRQR
jgi:hypothetical protein